MVGRGIDQILPYPGDPEIHERYMNSAADYVTLAERRSGPIPRGVAFDYVWGDLLDDLEQRRCDIRLINIETAITTSDSREAKGINYRMNPRNIGVLTVAGIDACTLANNHVMDWGTAGLIETLETLERAAIGQAGAGRSAQAASRPLGMDSRNGARLLVSALGAESSGVPVHWQARAERAGVNLLPRTHARSIATIREQIEPVRREDDLVVLSIHWGGNWGYGIPDDHRALAQALIDSDLVDVVFGHSSHHPMGIELYRGKLILYGCGDLINDYEGIGGHQSYRSELALAPIADLDLATGRLESLELLAYVRWAFSLHRADKEACAWMEELMRRESRLSGARMTLSAAGSIKIDLPENVR
jgi:poly-gamma-glutamate synthesis protein (capsule biosynthesis protein)